MRQVVATGALIVAGFTASGWISVAHRLHAERAVFARYMASHFVVTAPADADAVSGNIVASGICADGKKTWPACGAVCFMADRPP